MEKIHANIYQSIINVCSIKPPFISFIGDFALPRLMTPEGSPVFSQMRWCKGVTWIASREMDALRNKQHAGAFYTEVPSCCTCPGFGHGIPSGKLRLHKIATEKLIIFWYINIGKSSCIKLYKWQFAVANCVQLPESTPKFPSKGRLNMVEHDPRGISQKGWYGCLISLWCDHVWPNWVNVPLFFGSSRWTLPVRLWDIQLMTAPAFFTWFSKGLVLVDQSYP